MFTERQKSITFGLIRLFYEVNFTEGSPEFDGAENYKIDRRVSIKMPDDVDERSSGYDLFTTTIGVDHYVGIHRKWYGEYGGREGAVEGLIRYIPDENCRYTSFQRLLEQIDALIPEEFDWG